MEIVGYILGGMVAWVAIGLLVGAGLSTAEWWRDEQDRRDAHHHHHHHHGHRCCGEHWYGK